MELQQQPPSLFIFVEFFFSMNQIHSRFFYNMKQTIDIFILSGIISEKKQFREAILLWLKDLEKNQHFWSRQDRARLRVKTKYLRKCCLCTFSYFSFTLWYRRTTYCKRPLLLSFVELVNLFFKKSSKTVIDNLFGKKMALLTFFGQSMIIEIY